MQTHLSPAIEVRLIRGAFYLLLLMTVCAIPSAPAQRNTKNPSLVAAKKSLAAAAWSTSGVAETQPSISPAREGAAINKIAMFRTLMPLWLGIVAMFILMYVAPFTIRMNYFRIRRKGYQGIQALLIVMSLWGLGGVGAVIWEVYRFSRRAASYYDLPCLFITLVFVSALLVRALPGRRFSRVSDPRGVPFSSVRFYYASAGILMTLCLAIPGVLWIAGKADLVLVFAGALLGAVCGLPIAIAGRNSIDYDRAIKSPLSLEEYLAADPRPPVLYLRPFQMESYSFSSPNVSFEHFFVQRFWELGPFVALGNPDDYLPVVGGAVRLYASDVDWIQKFSELAQRSAYIVVETARSDNLKTEFEYLRRERIQEKLFVFTGHPQWEQRGWLLILGEKTSFGTLRMNWQAFSEDLAKKGYDLGFRDPGLGSVITFDAEGRGIVLTTQAKTAAEFVDPIRAWVERREKSGRCVPTSCLSCGQQFYVFPADTCKVRERWCQKCDVRLNALQRVMKKFWTRHRMLTFWVGFILMFLLSVIIFGESRERGGLFPEDSWAFQLRGLPVLLSFIVEICAVVVVFRWAMFRADQRLARRYQNLAESGDAVAMSNLGIMSRAGSAGKSFGGRISAAKWFRKAAEAGDIGGMINLAEMLEKGICGSQKDPLEATSWYQRAADLGSRAAQLHLNPRNK